MMMDALESVIRYAREKLMTQHCKQNTNFSPAEYAQAWEIYNA